MLKNCLFLCVFALAFFVGVQLAAAEGPYVGEAVTPYVFDGDLRDLPVSYLGKPGEPLVDVPLVAGAGSGMSFVDTGEQDPVVQYDVEGYAMPAPIQNFEGISYISAQVPDTNGDVGPNHYVQIVNVHFAIYDKSGTLLAGPTANNALWAGTGGLCETNNDGDPIVLYDHLADRWLLSQFVTWGTQCIAVSRGPNPVTDGWWLYEYNLGSLVNDYPKFGVWPDGYYMGTQRGYFGSGSDAWVFERAQMLNGNPASVQGFFDSGGFMLPADLDGPSPPGGAPGIFARLVDGAEFGGVDRLELYELDVDWNTPANSTFTNLPDLATAAFDRELCSGYDLMGRCIDQPGTTNLLESLSAWLMYRLQYRNFGTHETLVVNHTVDVGGDLAGIRWYELRKSGGNWSIYQQGTYSPDSTHRWMGSIAMDGDGNMALGYSVSSSSVYPGIRYTGRLASDPLGTLPQGETTIINGSGNVTWSYRWGDYSSMSVDPTDECTFWYTQEYMPASTEQWQTRIASFRFPECGGAPPVAVHDCVIDAQLDGSLTGPFTLDCSNGQITNSGTLVPTSGPNPGAFYWQMSPFIDIIEVGYEDHSNHWLAHGTWSALSYLLPVVGNLSQDDANVWHLGLHGTLLPAEIGGAAANSALSK
jgi:hypothetical protein